MKKFVVENNVTPPAVPPRGPFARSAHLRNAPPPPVPVKINTVASIKYEYLYDTFFLLVQVFSTQSNIKLLKISFSFEDVRTFNSCLIM